MRSAAQSAHTIEHRLQVGKGLVSKLLIVELVRNVSGRPFGIARRHIQLVETAAGILQTIEPALECGTLKRQRERPMPEANSRGAARVRLRISST